MHAIQCESYNYVSLLKIKLIREKIEIFEEMLIANGCEASIVVYTVSYEISTL